MGFGDPQIGRRLSLFALLLAGCAPRAPREAERPNFLVIVTDDQRPDTIGALGNLHIRTPHLDSLVRTGTTFTRATCAFPLCVPSRAEILTGCTGFRNGVLGRRGDRMDPALTLWPQALRATGYHAWYVGKWMNDGKPKTRGYEETRGLFSSGGGTLRKGEPAIGRKGRPITGYRNWTFKTDDGRVEIEKGVGLTARTSEYIADGAIEFLKRKPNRPYFLHVNFTAPHDPLVWPPGREGRPAPPLPPNFLPRHPFDHGNFEGRDEKLLPWPRTAEDVRDELAVYYAVIEEMDAQIGRILEAADRERTVVIFTSDHGLAIGSHGLMGKQNMYGHTIRVPMIFSGPGISRDRRTDAFCHLRDLYPTTCAMAGAAIPPSVEGRSLLAVIRGEADGVYPHVFGYFRHYQRMIRADRWKLVYYPEIGRHQLFDLRHDPYERRDLAGDPSHAVRLGDLRATMREWFADRGDTVRW